MQPLNWYIRRLRAMSPREAAWRVRSSLRDAADRPLVPLRRRAQPAVTQGQAPDTRGFTVCDVAPGEWAHMPPESPECQWLRRLCRRADPIAAGRLTFFDLHEHDCGRPIDWNRDPNSGARAPLRFAPWLDYRDFAVVGDCKYVWEPNRHHHLVVMARAYRAGGDIRYANALLEQWHSWLDQCPYGLGMNWRSGLELATRLINWVWAFDLVGPSRRIDPTTQRQLLASVNLHLWEITRKYSRESSANNHLIGEAAGVFIASSYFHSLRDARHWRAHSREILCRQIQEQTFPDGANREQAISYHLFVLQFLLLAGLVGRWSGWDFPPEYWKTLESMLDFVRLLREGGDVLPMFGDADDAYVLDIGPAGGDLDDWMATGAVLLERGDLKVASRGYAEGCRWLLGRVSLERYESLVPPLPDETLHSHAFPHAGCYLLQTGHRDSDDRLSVMVDCGQLGLGTIAAHGHADALSVTLRVSGVDVLVDPGTYDYFTYPKWREYFRSTRAHNTVSIDGQDQSVMQGPFLWGRRADARCLSWQPRADGATVVGEHDGYTRLADPVTHRRTVELDGPARQVRIDDEILAAGRHDVQVHFQLAEHCAIRQLGANLFEIATGRGTVTLEMDARLAVRIDRGCLEPIAGWVSRGYHRRCEAIRLTGRYTSTGCLVLHCRLTAGPPVAGNGSPPATAAAPRQGNGA